METHHLQRDILRRLSHHDRLTFHELQPDTLANNSFVYHLQRMIAAGYVKHEAPFYELTERGLSQVAGATRTKTVPIKHPLVAVLGIVRNGSDQYALLPRPAHPGRGRFTLPGGAIWFDDDVAVKMQEQLLEKLGCKPAIEHRGMVSIRLYQHDVLITHTYIHVYLAAVQGSPDLHSHVKRFKPEWVDVGAVPPPAIMPDVRQIIEYAHSGDGTFAEFSFEL